MTQALQNLTAAVQSLQSAFASAKSDGVAMAKEIADLKAQIAATDSPADIQALADQVTGALSAAG